MLTQQQLLVSLMTAMNEQGDDLMLQTAVDMLFEHGSTDAGLKDIIRVLLEVTGDMLDVMREIIEDEEITMRQAIINMSSGLTNTYVNKEEK